MSNKAAQAATEPESAVNPAPFKRWLMIPSLVLLLPVLAWLTFPAWAPGLIKRLAPADWALTTIETGRPGLQGLRVQRLEAEGRLVGLPLAVTAESLMIGYRGPVITAGDLRLVALPTAGVTERAPEPEKLLSLPRLVLPPGLPSVRIDRLEIVDGRRADGESYRFMDVALDGKSDGLVLKTDLSTPPPLAIDVTLELAMNGQRLLLTVADRSGNGAPIVRFEQAVDPLDPERALGALVWDLDLATLDRLALPALPGGSSNHFEALKGRLNGAAAFAGTDRLVLQSGQAKLESIAVTGTAFELTGGGLLDLVAEDDAFLLTAESLALALQVSPGHGLTVTSPVGQLLDASAPVELSVIVPAGPDTEPLAARYAPLADNRFDLSGSVRATLNQQETLALDGLLDRLDVSGTLQDSITMNSAYGRVLGKLSFDRPLSLRGETATIGASNGRAEISLEGNALGPNRRLRGAVSDVRLEGFSYSDGSSAMSLATLSMDGELALDRQLRFEGPVRGEQVVIASDAQALTPPLLTASEFTAALTTMLTIDAAPPAPPAPPGSPAPPSTVNGLIEFYTVALPVAESDADRVSLAFAPLTLDTLSGAVDLSTAGLNTRLDGTLRRGMDLDLRGSLEAGKRYEGNGELLLGYQAALPFAFQLEPADGRGQLTFEQAVLGPEALSALEGPLAIKFPESLSFDDGTITIDGQAGWNDEGPLGALDLSANELALSLGETRIEALNLQTRFELAEVLSGRGELRVAQTSLAAGLDVIALETGISVDGVDQLGLSNLQAELLGGLIAAPVLRLVEGRLQDSRLTWDGLDLQRLLAFLDVDGLGGTGILDAAFPLVAEAGGLAVREGTFAARAPGRLRYSSGVPAGNIGLIALENFEYDTLSGTLNYQSDGSYSISLDLLGRNPDLYGGHPIRFRLNLGGAMPSLFRSLFVTGDFEEGIIDRLRTGDPSVLPDR